MSIQRTSNDIRSRMSAQAEEPAAPSRGESAAAEQRSASRSTPTGLPQLIQGLQSIGVARRATASGSAARHPRADLLRNSQAVAASAPQASRNVSPAERLDELVKALSAYHRDDQQVSLIRQPALSRALAEPAFEQANEARGLLEKINGAQRREAEARRIPGFVLQMEIGAAYRLACTLPKVASTVEAATVASLAHDLDIPAWLRMIDDGIERLDRVSQEASSYQAVFKAAIRQYGTMSGIERPGAVDALNMAISGMAEALHQQHSAALGRTMLSALSISDRGGRDEELELVLAPFRAFSEENVSRVETLFDHHEDMRVPLRESEQREMSAHVDVLRGRIESVLLTGCKLAGEDTHPRTAALWPELLRFADSGRQMLSALENIRDLPRLPDAVAEQFHGVTRLNRPTRRPDVQAEKKEAAAQAAESRNTGRLSVGKESQASSSRAKSKKTRGSRRASTHSQSRPPVNAVPELSPTLELAQERLSEFQRPIIPAEGMPLDLVATGQRLQRDTALLRQIDNPNTDPTSVAKHMRASVEGWFGGLHRWRTTRAQVARDASGSGHESTALLAELDQRIASIETLLAQVDALELDRIKKFRAPKSEHVERLLSAKHVASVSKLRLLPSGPDPERSTVFEASIQPSPHSDGTVPPAIYLHLHTHEAMTTRECRALPPKAFAASHLKSAEQRAYGKNWEDLERSMGRDADVHRGATSDKLLKDVLRLMPAS